MDIAFIVVQLRTIEIYREILQLGMHFRGKSAIRDNKFLRVLLDSRLGDDYDVLQDLQGGRETKSRVK